MKQIYKVLISIFVISILASVLVSALETDTKGNTNVQENIASAKPTPTPTPTPYSAIFGMIDKKTYNFDASGWGCSFGRSSCWQSVTNYSFNLPYDSYVYIESSGWFANYEGSVFAALGIDNSNPSQYDMRTYRGYIGAPLRDGTTTFQSITGFQTSRTYYLAKGAHTIYLNADVSRNLSDPNTPVISGISITASVNTKGDLQIKN